MGHDVRIKTENISNGYLTLGLLEIARAEMQGKPLSQIAIIEKLKPQYEKDKGIVRKQFLRLVKSWLKKDKLSDKKISDIIKVNKRGYKLNDKIPVESYQDFVGSMLFLYLIYTDQHKDSVKDFIIDGDRENPLSFITKLILQQRDEKSVVVSHYTEPNVINKTEICRHKIKLINNIWILTGEKLSDYSQVEIKLSSIIKVNGFKMGL